MPTQYSLAALECAKARRSDLVRYKVSTDYWALIKPEVNILILITTLADFCLARPVKSYGFLLLGHTLAGVLLVGSGAGAPNQFVERHFDSQMRRTARPPLASGRLASGAVLRFGVLLSCAGCMYLTIAVNALASLLSVLTLLMYLFLYTPLKRRTPLCTLLP
jgi:heme o synthase